MLGFNHIVDLPGNLRDPSFPLALLVHIIYVFNFTFSLLFSFG